MIAAYLFPELRGALVVASTSGQRGSILRVAFAAPASIYTELTHACNVVFDFKSNTSKILLPPSYSWRQRVVGTLVASFVEECCRLFNIIMHLRVAAVTMLCSFKRTACLGVRYALRLRATPVSAMLQHHRYPGIGFEGTCYYARPRY